jgi:phosphoribosylformimino-5-aminoimidazole carboxamide ribotide isomerase
MRFRPCIDIHNGCVKQIVGGSLKDRGDQAQDNFVSQYDGSFYGELYKRDGFWGGHIILLNPEKSQWYEKDVEQAKLALNAYPGGLQLGGGINRDNAERFLDMGASHVIVTSYVFRDGIVDYERLTALSRQIGREHLVLDLSCRRYRDGYYIVTDRWQNRTEEKLTGETMERLGDYCDEFLIHGVDVEGKQQGIEKEIISMLGQWQPGTVTYAGGIRSQSDLEYIEKAGKGAVDFTVGSALDLFGGDMPYQNLRKYR